VTNSNGVDAGLLRSRYRLTKQRAAVLTALDDGAHLTAEALLERVRAQLPGVSLGTIYRTVDILREIGLVQVFSHNGMAARYEASLSKHHHLLCDICHDITNVNVPSLGPVARAIADQHRYDQHRYADVDASLTVTGRCANCAAQALPAHSHLERDLEPTAANRE
jgi:Fur family peroxide stress response transcriptional regulator